MEPLATSAGVAELWAGENPLSEALHERAARVLPGGVTHDVRRAEPFGVAVTRAAGSRKWDADGHELICYVMGHGALLLGHNHPDVVAAVQEQATKVFLPGASHELETEWAELITELVPCAEMARFTASGTEATLLALRLARAVTGRDRIVKLAGHFHGWHDQVAIGADEPFSEPDTAGLPSGIVSGVTVIPADAAALAEALAGGDVAAVICEPSGAAWATVPLPGGFLQQARDLTAAAGTLLVFDEVVTGFRWSPGGVQQVAGVTPDLTALGKIMAGGMPAGAVCGPAGLLTHISARRGDPAAVKHPGTHNAHPLSAAAGIATLRLAGTGEPQRAAAECAATLRDGFNTLFAKHGVQAVAYGESSTFHLLFGHEEAPETLSAQQLKRSLDPRLSAGLHCGMLREGVHLFHGSGFVSSAHTAADAERTLTALDTTLHALKAERLL